MGHDHGGVLYAVGLALVAESQQAAFPEGEMQLANLNLT
jgi:hypothetical protein